MSEYEQSVFISYAWRGESEAVVNQIDETLQQRGLTIIRDKRTLGYKGSISAFMERIGQGNCIIVVISDKYLRSQNCMFELVEIADGKNFHGRVFPVVLSDADIYDPVKRLDYVRYWETKRTELAQAMQTVDPANLQGIREDIDLYDRIRDKVSNLTSILKDMNTLTPEMHKDSDFSEIYSGIKRRMTETGGQANRSIDIRNANDKLLTSSALRFQVKQEFIKELQHIDFIKQNKSSVSLEEIFVFPSLSKSKDAFEKENLDIEYFLQKKEDMTIIKGSDSSGKTALLNWLFLKLSENYSPVFINASEIAKVNNSKQLIKNTFQKEYDGSFDDWMSLENKIAIIDNYHHNLPIAFLDFLSANFSMVIVAVDEDEWMAYLKDDPGYAEFTVASINQMSLAKQEELIKNWKMLDLGDGTISVDDLTVDKLEATVNNVITRNRIVPRYPFYILSILQTFESFMPKDYSITAYGHCYQALVVAQMMKKGIKGEQIDDCFNFLRHLAFDIYQKKTDGEIYTTKDYLSFKQKYGERFFIQSSLLNRLENNEYEIIKIGERVNFTLDYTYYFFVGMYLAFAHDQDELLSKLVEEIHLKQNALIVIFTVHHTQNKAMLENILAHCICCFDGVKAAELTVEETQFMNELIAELPDDIVSKKSVGETRKEIRERQDREHDDSDREDKEAEEVKAIDINKGLRILEVLGQILKNRGGSFERDIVLETLESTIDLGLRILNLLLDSFRTPEFSEWLGKSLEDFEREYISEHHRSFSDEKRKKFVAKTIQIMGYMLTVSMLNRISFSVNSEKLMEAVGILSDKKKTPAYQMIGFLSKSSQNGLETQELKQLIASFDKNKNFWAKKTLSYYAQGYLSTHNIKYNERQKIYKILEIDYVPNKKLT
jgi:hypothetical protein